MEGRSNKALYAEIMEALKIVSRWKDIKRAVELSLGNVDDKTFSEALHKLVNAGFVEEREGVYVIADPVLRRVEFRRLVKGFQG